MDFKEELENSGGVLSAYRDEEKVAYANLHFDTAESMVITYVYVSPLARGTGTGGAMVEAAVNLARRQNRKVRATCSYAAAVLQRRRDQYGDVLL